MNIPAQVRIGATDYEVIEVPVIANALNPKYYGMNEPTIQKISLCQGLGAQQNRRMGAQSLRSVAGGLRLFAFFPPVQIRRGFTIMFITGRSLNFCAVGFTLAAARIQPLFLR